MKLRKKDLSLLVGVLLIPGLTSAANFNRQDIRYITYAEMEQRQPSDNQQQAYGPLNFDSPQVYNIYFQNQALPKVEAYMSNWGQYGRKWSSKNISDVYDTVVFSFLGMCGTSVGDPDITSAVESLKNFTCNENINTQKPQDYEVMITDIWGDLAAEIPDMTNMIGFPENSDLSMLMELWYRGQNDVNHGALGALKKLHQESPNTTIAFSVGGWSLSELFSEMARDPVARGIFIDSIVKIFKNYPMFKQIDIDWEYPGGGGAELNQWASDDAHYYKMLVSELSSALEKNGKADVKIAVAAGAPKNKIDASDLKGLITSGVDIIHLMTYDFFGTPWSVDENGLGKLAHHTNLFSYKGSDWSVDDSVSYMIDELKIDPKKIYIGYANYSRNAAEAKVDNYSPLQGSYTMPSGKYVGGSWEKGTFEWYDIQQELLSISASDGLSINKIKYPNYKLLTDKEANADYIYSQNGKFFVSFDTPRTVYAKAKYVKEKGLGGIFNWMADYDNGYMVNAAREGLGYTRVDGIDMENIIFSCGENVTTAHECEELTTLGGDGGVEPLHADAGEDQNARLQVDHFYSFNGASSTGENIAYLWKVKSVQGVSAESIVLKNKRTATPKLKIQDGYELADNISIKLKLKVTDEAGNTDFDNVTLSLVNAENLPPTAVANASSLSVEHGSSFMLLGESSTDPDGDELTYKWSQVTDGSVILNNPTNVNVAVDTSTLSNINQELTFRLKVNDGTAKGTDTVTVSIIATEDGNGNGNGGGSGDGYDYVYPEGLGSYAAGTIVKFPGQGIYECFGPWAAFCNSPSYAPGIAADPGWVSQQWKLISN